MVADVGAELILFAEDRASRSGTRNAEENPVDGGADPLGTPAQDFTVDRPTRGMRLQF
jgi:hypothetical protein